MYDLYHAWINNIAEVHLLKRAGLAFITSAILVLLLGRPFIKLVRTSKLLQPIRDDGPQTHLKKHGTPTLGGVLIIVAFFLSSLIWLVQINSVILIILLSTLGFTVLGLVDDLMKLMLKNSRGLRGKLRLLIGFAIAGYAMYHLITLYPPEIAKSVFFPFFSSFYVWIGSSYLLFGSFVIVGTANSVNLTDGLDGLASLVVGTILVSIMIILLVILTPGVYTNFLYSSLFYFNDIREIAIIIGSLIGAVLGFLWYNSSPAKIFMGDVGSLGIGGALGIIVVALKQELFLLVAGLILALESLSVIIQVYSYKLRKKRVFLMAPLHHHFEKKGVAETTVVKRIWLFTVFCCIVALLAIDI